MDLDTNQPCPGGTGKKIRFCCKDLTRELDKIFRLREGGQRRAALEMIDKTLASKGDRPCLYALKADIQTAANDVAGAQATMAAFAQRFPDNPVALAEGALAALQGGRLAEAVDHLQSALERSSEQIEEEVYGAFGLVARGLLLDGNLPAARAHLMMQADLSRGRDPEPLALLSRINQAPQSSAPLKFALDLETEAPPDAPWRSEFRQAVESASHGEWRRALEVLKGVAEKDPASPVVRKNVALLASRLGDRQAAVQAWRQYASLESVAWDDRVEAEAAAQLLEPPHDDDLIDEVRIVYAIQDLDALMERLVSDPRLLPFEGDLRELVEENETPPKAVFSLLDRPEKLPEGQTLTVETVPNVVAEVFVFGRRTDREARLELTVYRDERRETAQQTLTDAARDALGPVEGEEVLGRTTRMATVLSWRWRFPPDTPPEQREELMRQKRHQLIFDKWPNLPRAALGGRTPREAAQQDASRVAAAATVLLLELAGQQMEWDIDFNQLRRELGLPTVEPIDPATVSVELLPVTRLGRLEVEKLSNEDLITAYYRAGGFAQTDVFQRLAREVLQRESLRDRIDQAVAHRVVANSAKDPKEALAHLHKAQEIVVKRGESPASLLLEEFRFRLATGEGVAECKRILERLRANHMNEPGVAEELAETFIAFGMATPDGRPTAAFLRQEEAGPAPSPASAAEPSPLWTPGAPATQEGQKKSSLWTPEID